MILKCPACGNHLPIARAAGLDEDVRMVCPFCETLVRRRVREVLAS